MENTQERLLRYLDDAWAVEKAQVSALRDMAQEVNDSQVRALLEAHREMTWQQEEALEARIRKLGKEPAGSKGFFNQMMAKLGDLFQGAHDEYDKTTQDLIRAYATEHFEVAMYEALEAYATAVGDQETAQLARQHSRQERETAEKLWPLIGPTASRAVAAAAAK